jgi:hypothetical protein
MAEQDARGALAVARQEGHKSGLAEGHMSGLAEGKRDALLRLLARRGLSPTADESKTIAAYADVATLDKWFDAALTAGSVAEVLK